MAVTITIFQDVDGKALMVAEVMTPKVEPPPYVYISSKAQ